MPNENTYIGGKLYKTNLDSKEVIKMDGPWTGRIDSWPSQEAMLQNAGKIMSYPPRLGMTTMKYPFANVTFSNYGADNRPTSLTTNFSDNSMVAITTCPMSSVAFLLWATWSVSMDQLQWFDPSEEWLIKVEHGTNDSSNTRSWKQPMVAIECPTNYLHKGGATFDFDYIPFKKTLRLTLEEYPIFQELASTAGSSLGPGYRFLNLRDSMDLPISADIIFGNETWSDDRQECNIWLKHGRVWYGLVDMQAQFGQCIVQHGLEE
ncbi:hypothetical protein BGZ63DRAFT_406180 [Mariannaea sp. PMI_226]|nr:hypothetical protein BGZ63DRAFT_406180 [Mariannaea sp. PMI_226]